MANINELMNLYQELDRVQNSIKERLDGGERTYTKEELEKCIQDDEETKILLAKMKEIL